jgi:hypothetical protein
VNYLYYKDLHIIIWDADSLMQFGVAKLPLKYFLRKQKNIIEKDLEISVISSDLNSEKGKLYIYVANKGHI